MKTCCRCKIPQPLDNFHKERRHSDGRHSQCKTCRAQSRKPYWQTYYSKHRGKIAIKDAQYRKTNKQAVLIRNRDWNRKDHQLHPEKKRCRRAIRRARGKSTLIEPISLEVLAIRDNWTCHLCKRQVTRKNWSHDHIIPRASGGDTTYLNVALCHQRCNSSRGPGRIPAQASAVTVSSVTDPEQSSYCNPVESRRRAYTGNES